MVVTFSKLLKAIIAVDVTAVIVPLGILNSLYELKNIGLDSAVIAVLIVISASLGPITVVLILLLLIRLLQVPVWGQANLYRKEIRTSPLGTSAATDAGSEAPSFARLIPSVTEHTTRTFYQSTTTG